MNATSRQTNANYLDTDALCEEAEAAGLAWADAKAAADALEETRKSVLATTMASHLGDGMAVSKAETLALADEAYMDFVRRMVSARKAADRARVKYDILRTRIELLRTNASTERAAMNLR
jgi:hypothetical protein